MKAAFWALAAAEVAYALLWRDPPLWPGIVIVASALVVGVLVLLDPDR